MQKKALFAAIVTMLALVITARIFNEPSERAQQPPAATAPAAEGQPAGGTPAPVALPEVELYTTSWCPACREAIRYLREKNIPFAEYDVEKDGEAARRFTQLNPRGAVPFAVIGEEKILGFDQQAYADALGLN